MTIYQKGTPKFIIKWQTILVCQNNNNVVYQMTNQNYRPKGHTRWLSKGETKTFHKKKTNLKRNTKGARQKIHKILVITKRAHQLSSSLKRNSKKENQRIHPAVASHVLSCNYGSFGFNFHQQNIYTKQLQSNHHTNNQV